MLGLCWKQKSGTEKELQYTENAQMEGLQLDAGKG
jgi:hypothetical protein